LSASLIIEPEMQLAAVATELPECSGVVGVDFPPI